MRNPIALSLFFLVAGFEAVTSFVPSSHCVACQTSNDDALARSHLFSSKDSIETEAERLIRKAREIRASAEQAEQQVHDALAQKKSNKDAQTDKLIDDLFFSADDQDDDRALVDRLRSKRLGVNTLEKIVDRLNEREVSAQALDHVEFKTVNDKAQVHRVSTKDEQEMERLARLIDRLIQAVGVLDQEFLAGKKAKGEKFMAHAEQEHWGGGKCAERLNSRIREYRRERSEQFQKRMEEFREAQRRKDDPDHKFKGYTDLGSLN